MKSDRPAWKRKESNRSKAKHYGQQLTDAQLTEKSKDIN